MPYDFVPITNCRLLEWEGIYGIWPYIPSLSVLMKSKTSERIRRLSKKIYNFKRYGKSMEEIRLLIMAIEEIFNCERIVVIPPSHPEGQPSILQKLFGINIKRVKNVEPRKYNHKRELGAGYENSYIIKDDIKEKCLLIDDIITSGVTMRHFMGRLAANRIEVVPLAIGMYYRLPYREADYIAIFEKTKRSIKKEKEIFKDMDFDNIFKELDRIEF